MRRIERLGVVLISLCSCATATTAVPDEDAGATVPARDSGAPSFTQSCANNAQKYCTQYQMCFGAGFAHSYGTIQSCVQWITDSCALSTAVPDAGWTPATLDACVQARSAMSCSDFLLGNNYPKTCYPTGPRTDGSACAYSHQCASGYCKMITGASCGTCIPRAIKNAPCNTTSDCQIGLACAKNGTCQMAIAANEACDDARPCKPNLYCKGQLPNMPGICTKPGAPNELCDPNLGGVDCDYFAFAWCDGSTKKCGTYVTADDGHPCGALSPGVYTLCRAKSGCRNGVCNPPNDVGAQCDPAMGIDCKRNAQCMNGMCTMPKYTCN